jgi:transcriptional regulator with XRE-family HTH domain
MELYEKVRAIRNLRNMNQEPLATDLGITIQGYSRKETGKTQFTTTEIEKVARRLNVPVTIFFGNELNIKFNDDKKEQEVS